MNILIKQNYKIDPTVLTHPTIPKPLHGVNPRTINGKKWWDETRKKVYADNNFRCYACGIKKEAAKPRPVLEAHEYYDIDYNNGIVTLKFLIPLCPTCHKFIHSGRTWSMYLKKEIDSSTAKYIIKRGMKILKKNNLKPYFFTRMVELNLFHNIPMPMTFDLVKEEGLNIPQSDKKWNEWYLELNGEKYYSNFKNRQEWIVNYNMNYENEELEYINNNQFII